jgi:hypothetical protein
MSCHLLTGSLRTISIADECPLTRAFILNNHQPEAGRLQVIVSRLNRRRCPQRLRFKPDQKGATAKADSSTPDTARLWQVIPPGARKPDPESWTTAVREYAGRVKISR